MLVKVVRDALLSYGLGVLIRMGLLGVLYDTCVRRPDCLELPRTGLAFQCLYLLCTSSFGTIASGAPVCYFCRTVAYR